MTTTEYVGLIDVDNDTAEIVDVVGEGALRTVNTEDTTYALTLEERFEATYVEEDLRDDESFNVYIEAPGGASFAQSLFSGVAVRPQTRSKLDIFTNVTVDVAGTTVDAFNQNIGSATNNEILIESNIQFSGGTGPFTELLQGAPGNQSNTVETVKDQFILTPGNNILFRVTNDGGRTGDAQIKSTWQEDI